MQLVYSARDEMEAHFVRGLLEVEGIPAVVEGEPLQQTWGNLPLTPNSLPSVWVEDTDVAKAAPIVDEYRRREEAEATVDCGAANDPVQSDCEPKRATWTCPNCGEKVE